MHSHVDKLYLYLAFRALLGIVPIMHRAIVYTKYGLWCEASLSQPRQLHRWNNSQFENQRPTRHYAEILYAFSISVCADRGSLWWPSSNKDAGITVCVYIKVYLHKWRVVMDLSHLQSAADLLELELQTNNERPRHTQNHIHPLFFFVSTWGSSFFSFV